MEVYSKTTRFALACNNSDQIIGVFVHQYACYSYVECVLVCSSVHVRKYRKFQTYLLCYTYISRWLCYVMICCLIFTFMNTS